MDVIVAFILFGHYESLGLVRPASTHHSHDVHAGLQRPQPPEETDTLASFFSEHARSVCHNIDHGLAKWRSRQSVLVDHVHDRKRILVVDVNFGNKRIHDHVLEQRDSVFVTEDPEAGEKGPFGVNLCVWFFLVLGQ